MNKADYIEIIVNHLIDLRQQESNIIDYMERIKIMSSNEYLNEELNIVIHQRQLLEEILEEIKNKKEGN